MKPKLIAPPALASRIDAMRRVPRAVLRFVAICVLAYAVMAVATLAGGKDFGFMAEGMCAGLLMGWLIWKWEG